MQALFTYRFHPRSKPLALLEEDLKNQPAKNLDLDLAQKLLKLYYKHKEKIDKIIQVAAPEWPLKKINAVDLAILRLAVSELLYLKETPPKVAIDEAVEIAKQFGSESSHRFVNGVLGTIYRESPRYEEESKKTKS